MPASSWEYVQSSLDPILGMFCRTVWLLMLSDEGDNSPPLSTLYYNSRVWGASKEMGVCSLVLRPSINYHHHLFYIREPFVTKKGILTVCLMGETFKLEQTHIYHTTPLSEYWLSCSRDNPISSPIWNIFILIIFWLDPCSWWEEAVYR